VVEFMVEMGFIVVFLLLLLMKERERVKAEKKKDVREICAAAAAG
jgi:hypothetical protein